MGVAWAEGRVGDNQRGECSQDKEEAAGALGVQELKKGPFDRAYRHWATVAQLRASRKPCSKAADSVSGPVSSETVRHPGEREGMDPIALASL